MLFEVSQQRFVNNVFGRPRIIGSTWLDAPTHEAANRAYRATHRLAAGDWLVVKNLEDGSYNAKLFSDEGVY